MAQPSRQTLSWALAGAFVLAHAAGAATVLLSDPNARFSANGTSPCPRGDPNDTCVASAYLTQSPSDSSATVFANAWNAWNGARGPGQQWTLVQGRQLNGVISVTRFNTFNNCPNAAGIEVRALYYSEADDPTGLNWVQGLLTNREADVVPGHDATPPAPFAMMDVGTGRLPNEWPAPAYPIQYANGQLYDRATAYCQHECTIQWNAVALLANINYQTRTLTVYEGFSYGFTVSCEHQAPAPGPVGLAGLGVLAMGSRRRR